MRARNNRQEENSLQKIAKFIWRHKLVLFVIFLILTGGLLYVYGALTRNPRTRMPPLDPYRNTHVKANVTFMRGNPRGGRMSEEKPQFLKKFRESMVVTRNLAKTMTAKKVEEIKNQVWHELEACAEHPTVRDKMLRVFNSKDFKFLIEQGMRSIGIPVNYDKESNTLVVYYDHDQANSYKKELKLRSTFNSIFHQADWMLITNGDQPFNSDREYQQLKLAIEKCESAMIEELSDLREKYIEGTATESERKRYDYIRDHILNDYQPSLIRMETELESNPEMRKMVEDRLKNNKPVILQNNFGNVYVDKLEYERGMIIARGRHAKQGAKGGELVEAWVLDNFFYRDTIEDRLDKKDVLAWKDRQFHGKPKITEYFCEELTGYHQKFRKTRGM